MKILMSNDDGVHAPSLHILANALKQIADVTVVAPDRNRSGASNSLSLEHPLRVRQLENGYYSVGGTPTDCIFLALSDLLDQKPDLVVSGINVGANLGDDIFYSGTVAAATEGRFFGLPAIAVSLAGKQLDHYATAANVAKNIVCRLQNEPLPADTILNVNVPDLALSDIQGYEITRLGMRHRVKQTIRETDPRGNTIYWVAPPAPELDGGVGTDFYAVNAGKVSITPLHVDLTHYNAFDHLSTWMNGMDFEA